MNAIDRADAGIFAERQQDLIGLIDYWRSKGRFGRHAEMMEYSIDVKLKEHNPDKNNSKPLSCDETIRGARNIAAAATFGKKNSIVCKRLINHILIKRNHAIPVEILWQQGFVVIFGHGEGQLAKDIFEIVVRFKGVGFCCFDKAVKCGAGLGALGCV
jgi:hypothetical protein